MRLARAEGLTMAPTMLTQCTKLRGPLNVAFLVHREGARTINLFAKGSKTVDKIQFIFSTHISKCFYTHLLKILPFLKVL